MNPGRNPSAVPRKRLRILLSQFAFRRSQIATPTHWTTTPFLSGKCQPVAGKFPQPPYCWKKSQPHSNFRRTRLTGFLKGTCENPCPDTRAIIAASLQLDRHNNPITRWYFASFFETLIHFLPSSGLNFDVNLSFEHQPEFRQRFPGSIFPGHI